VGIILLIASGILFVFSPTGVSKTFQENISLIVKILGLTILAVIISMVIHYVVPRQYIERNIAGTRKWHFLYAGILGIITPGPVYAIYPIIFALKKKGAQNAILVSYITGQTLIGPARIPLEADLLGSRFFLYRVLLTLIMAPLAGILYALLSKRFPDPDVKNDSDE
jgi:uncharacterized membrane protein YraQ (UPF0718 family)